MTAPTDKWMRRLDKWLWLGPALVLGLYAGRLSSELLHPSVVGAVLLTSVATFGAILVLRRSDFWSTWPFLILSWYVVYPEPDPQIAVAAALASAIALAQVASHPSLDTALNNRRIDVLVASIIGIGFLTLYVNTLSPDVLPADAGELQLVAARWGVAHPPGFPLYTIVANLFSRIPVGSGPAYRSNLLSAVTSTGTVLLVYLAVLRLVGSRLSGLVAALALGTSTTFWSQATTANVRSMTALFTAAAFYLLLVLRERQLRVTATDGDSEAMAVGSHEMAKRRNLWLQAGFVIVLVLAVTHHSSLTFIGGIFALYILYIHPSIIKDRGRWPVLILAALFALLPLLYLPIRGAAGAIGAPENLDSLQGFVGHVLGLGFRGDLFFIDQPALLWTRLAVMANVMTFQFSPFLLLVMLTGLILLFTEDRLLTIVLAISIATHTIVAAVYRAPQTVEYMLPVYVLVAILFGYAVGRLRRLQIHSEPRTLRGQMTALVGVLLVTFSIVAVFNQAARNYDSYRWLSNDTTARDYALPILRDAPPGAIVLADWHWATPLWYLQAVEGIRPDVKIEFVFPGSETYADTWARRIGEELEIGGPVIATHFEPAAYANLPASIPFHEAFIFSQDPLVDLPDGYVQARADLGQNLNIEGYRIDSERIEPGQELTVDIAWEGTGDIEPGRKLYAHLLGPDGRLYAGDDQAAMAQPAGLAVSQFKLTPLLQTPDGQLELVVGSYDGQGDQDEAYLTHVQVTAAKSSPITVNQTYRPLAAEDKTLIGYDWDSTLPGRQRLYLHWSLPEGIESQVVDVDGGQYVMPVWYGPWGIEKADSSFVLEQSSAYVPFGQGLVWLGRSSGGQQEFRPGDSVSLAQEFTTSWPVLSDLVVSMRLVGYEADGMSWAWWDLDDSVPATGAIPTLKWIIGSRIRHPVTSTVGADAWQGQEIEPLLLLYDAFTSRQLPILDERMSQSAPWIPLGREVVVSDAE